MQNAVLTVTAIQAGKAYNVIPQEAKFWGTIRTLDRDVRALVMKRLDEIVNGIAAAFGATVEIQRSRKGIPSPITTPTRPASPPAWRRTSLAMPA